MEKSNLPIAVIGLGKTGISIAKYLKKNNQNFLVYDTRINLEITNEIKKYVSKENIILGDFKKKYIGDHDNFIISPGINLKNSLLNEIANKRKNIQTDIDIFNDRKRDNVICITGSNGKTTVTLIIEHILKSLGKKVKAGGNVGLPALELLEDNYQYNILELSSFQLEMTKKINSVAALITNITPDHLDRHKTFENYIKIKHKVFKNSKNIIINLTDKNIRKNDYKYKFSFGGIDKKESNFSVHREREVNYIYQGLKKLISEKDILLIGYHNLINICASLTVIESLGLDIQKSIKSIKEFKCVEHRMESFYSKENITWINDSKSTNIDSTISAINSLDNFTILLMGGKSKTNNYSSLEVAAHNKVDTLILFGECRKLLKENIKSVKNIIMVKSLDKAVIEAMKSAENIRRNNQNNINILLSPACSSFDMFKSYEERGVFFKECVLNLYR